MNGRAAVCALALLAACGPDQVGFSRSLLSQSTVTSGAPAVGLLSSSSGESCTGTLISDLRVLTAAHCALAGATFTLGAEQRTVVSQVNHPLAGRPSVVGSDVALLTLDRAVGVVPAAIEPGGPAVGQLVALYGFGRDEAGVTGLKREAHASVARVEGANFSIEAPGPTACAGDSGGPAFGDSVQVVGVISSGVQQCGGETHLVSLYAYRPWVMAQLGVPAADAPPTLTVLRPGDGATMPVTFSMSVEAGDDLGVVLVEWRVDGQTVAQRTTAGAEDLALTPGEHRIEVEVFDGSNQSAVVAQNVNVVGPSVAPRSTGAPCWDATDCDVGICDQKLCKAPPARAGCETSPGAVGIWLAVWALALTSGRVKRDKRIRLGRTHVAEERHPEPEPFERDVVCPGHDHQPAP